MAKAHSGYLPKACRLCAQLLTEDKFEVKNLKERIKKAFYIETENDNPDIHPQNCTKCYSSIQVSSEKRDSAIKHQYVDGEKHSDTDCKFCNSVITPRKGAELRNDHTVLVDLLPRPKIIVF